MDKQQQEINDGQRKINGALCYVDWYVIEALEELIKALENNGSGLRINLDEAKKAIKVAYDTSPKVAGIEPPGCDRKFFSQTIEDARAA